MVFDRRKLSPWFLLALLLVLAWVSFQIVAVFLNYVLVGLFFAYLTYPVYRRIHRHIRSGPVASILMLILITALVLLPTAFLVAQLMEELRHIIVTVGSVDVLLHSLSRTINEFIGREPDGTTAAFLNNALLHIQAALSELARRLPLALAEGFVGVFVLLYVMYYTYIGGPGLVDYIRSTLPLQENHRELLFHEIGNVVRAVMFGSVLTALIQAILGGIGFLIFGVPGVILWSVVMFILALLPVVGPPIVWVPATIYLWQIDRGFAAIGLFIYSFLMVSTIDNLIRPKLIGSRARVHPVIILLGVLGGIVVFGFSGFILGPLVLCIFITTLNVFRKELAERGAEPQAGIP